MSNEHVKGPHHPTEIDPEKRLWIHKEPPESQLIRKRILGKAAEIGIIVFFTNFIYTFDGKLYLQQDGAPIGTRLACAAANVHMEYLYKKVKSVVQKGVKEVECEQDVEEAVQSTPSTPTPAAKELQNQTKESQEIQEPAVPVPTATAPPRGGVSVTATQSLDRDGTRTRKIQLLSADNFVDDTRTFTTVLRRGTRYCVRSEQFVWSRAWELEEAQDVSRRDTTNREF